MRPLGIAVCGTGLAVIGYAVGQALGTPAWLATILAVVAGLLAALSLLAAFMVLRPPTILQLDDEGFRVRRLGGGTDAGSWRDVLDVAGEVRAGAQVAIIHRRDGQSTLLPLGVLDAPAQHVEADVHRRLNSAHGYRRLDR